MRKLCERPGCGAPAEASYGIDSVQLIVWIDNRAILERELAGRLCRRHADALVVPRGWTVDDRREPIPKLFVVPERPSDTASHGRAETRTPRASAQRDHTDVGLFDAVDPAPAEEVVTDAVAVSGDEVTSRDEETKAIPWSPRLMRQNANNDDDADAETGSSGDVPPVMGRLLGRAFGRQRDSQS